MMRGLIWVITFCSGFISFQSDYCSYYIKLMTVPTSHQLI